MQAEEKDEGSVASGRVALDDAAFKAELAATIPHLRAYGRSISGNRDLADDLVQETLLRALNARERFEAGTSMRAWTFIILRNLFLSQMRRNKFKSDWDEDAAERMTAESGGQDGQINLADVQRALMTLPAVQREALILVGAGGFSYEEAAEISDVALGTIKSRVARARKALEEALEGSELAPRSEQEGGSDPVSEIMLEVDKLSREND